MFAKLSPETSSTLNVSGWDDNNLEDSMSDMISALNPSPPINSKAIANATSPRKLNLSVLDIKYVHGKKKYDIKDQNDKSNDHNEVRAPELVGKKGGNKKNNKKKSSGKKEKKPSKKKLLEDLELKYESSRKLLLKTFKSCCQTLGVQDEIINTCMITALLSKVPDTKQKESWLMDKISCRGDEINAAVTRAFISSLNGKWLGGSAIGKMLSTGYEYIQELEFVDCHCGAVGVDAIAQYLNTGNGKSLRKLSFLTF